MHKLRRHALPGTSREPLTSGQSQLLASSLERLGFLEWRLEQLEATEQAAQLQLHEMRRRLAEESLNHANAQRQSLKLEEQLATEREENASLSERLAVSENLRRRLEAERDTRHQQEMREELFLLQNQVQKQTETLRLAQERAELLERSQSRFFERLVGWQHAHAEDDDSHIAFGDFVAELRAEILGLREENQCLRMAREPRALLADTVLPAPELVSGPPASSWESVYEAPRATELPFSLAGLNERQQSRAIELFEELGSERRWRRLAAGRDLLALLGARAGEALALALDHAEDPEERIEWLDLLAKSQNPAARAAAARRLGDADWRVRASALSSFLRLSTQKNSVAELSEATTVLESALGDADPRVRRRAITASSEITSPEVTPLLAAAARDPDAKTRRAALLLLAHHSGPSAEPALARALHDPSPEVRSTAKRALNSRKHRGQP